MTDKRKEHEPKGVNSDVMKYESKEECTSDINKGLPMIRRRGGYAGRANGRSHKKTFTLRLLR